METTAAIKARHSVRAFLPDAVEREKIEAILTLATLAPSWADSQPWDVFVAVGDALASIKDGFAAKYAAGEHQTTDIARPASWPDAAKAHTQEMIESQNTGEVAKAFEDFRRLNRELFDAPAVAFLCLDNQLSNWSMFDLGAYAMNFQLAAKDLELDSIVAINLVLYPDVIRETLKIPENLQVVIGIAFGYADDEHPINNYQAPRCPLTETAHILDRGGD